MTGKGPHSVLQTVTLPVVFLMLSVLPEAERACSMWGPGGRAAQEPRDDRKLSPVSLGVSLINPL